MKHKTTKWELFGYVCNRLCKYRDKAEDQDELYDSYCECEIEELVDGLAEQIAMERQKECDENADTANQKEMV